MLNAGLEVVVAGKILLANVSVPDRVARMRDITPLPYWMTPPPESYDIAPGPVGEPTEFDGRMNPVFVAVADKSIVAALVNVLGALKDALPPVADAANVTVFVPAFVVIVMPLPAA